MAKGRGIGSDDQVHRGRGYGEDGRDIRGKARDSRAESKDRTALGGCY
jgi:hypothetical protein